METCKGCGWASKLGHSCIESDDDEAALAAAAADRKALDFCGAEEEKPPPGIRLPLRYGRSVLSPVSAGLTDASLAVISSDIAGCGLVLLAPFPASLGMRVGVVGFE